MRTPHLIGTCLTLIVVVWTAGCGRSGTQGPLAPAPPRPATTAPAPAPPPPGQSSQLYAVKGVVSEATEGGLVPVAGAYVEVCGYDSDWSAADGSYGLLAMPPGAHLILVRRNGFKELALSVSVSSDIKLDLRMERE